MQCLNKVRRMLTDDEVECPRLFSLDSINPTFYKSNSVFLEQTPLPQVIQVPQAWPNSTASPSHRDWFGDGHMTNPDQSECTLRVSYTTRKRCSTSARRICMWSPAGRGIKTCPLSGRAWLRMKPTNRKAETQEHER